MKAVWNAEQRWRWYFRWSGNFYWGSRTEIKENANQLGTQTPVGDVANQRPHVLTSISREHLHPFISMLSAACVPQWLPTHPTYDETAVSTLTLLLVKFSKQIYALIWIHFKVILLNWIEAMNANERRYCFFIIFSSCCVSNCNAHNALALRACFGSFVRRDRCFIRAVWVRFLAIFS